MRCCSFAHGILIQHQPLRFQCSFPSNPAVHCPQTPKTIELVDSTLTTRRGRVFTSCSPRPVAAVPKLSTKVDIVSGQTCRIRTAIC
jgi:hypothetical protein